MEENVYSKMDKGIPVDNLSATSETIINQTHTVSKYSDPVQKKLALAYVNEKLDPKFMNKQEKRFIYVQHQECRASRASNF